MGATRERVRTRIRLGVVCIIIIAWGAICQAATIYVPGNYPTIQEAINAAAEGDEIIVSPSTYVENISFSGSNIILRSTDPTNPALVQSTIIDGNQSAAVVTFSGWEDESCVLSGFTIMNGKANSGGGIRGWNTLATIQYDIITSNTGGGIADCDGIIQHNIIQNNSTTSYGGGLSKCDGLIRNNIVSSNAAGDGGGIYDCNGIIQNNTVWGNTASWWGGGLYACNGFIQNNTIADNSAGQGGGIMFCSEHIDNCIIWGNTATTDAQISVSNIPFYSCIQDWSGGGRGNIASAPQFVNPSNANYHLQSGSPCVNTGSAWYLLGSYHKDIDGECRVVASSVDMGSDEYGSSPDSDGDLRADSDEPSGGSDPNDSDSDDDGLIDGIEVMRGTNPTIFTAAPGISVPAQCASVQQGIFYAFPGETVTVSPATYNENLHLMGKNITVQSTNPYDSAIVAATVIDGNALFPVVSFYGNESESCIVRGLHIRNGSAEYGGGIHGNGMSATIQYNMIADNSAYAGGGLFECDGIIEYNTVSGNSAIGDFEPEGGGLWGCDGIIQYNTITGNLASGEDAQGGGLADCNGTIIGNTITLNTVTWKNAHGGGLCTCEAVILYNSICNNTADGGGGGVAGDGIIRNNIISDNVANFSGGGVAWCDWEVSGNIISGNRANDHGGGLDDCDAVVRNNIISHNSSEYGGGVVACGGTVERNDISYNSASANGGGFLGCTSTIQNNIIHGNWAADSGGGLGSCPGVIRNNTIYNNTAGGQGGGLEYCQGTISNCIVWGNSAPVGPQLNDCAAPTYCCIQDWSGGAGNIASDPLLSDPAQENFHLQPTSPCIDAGGLISALTRDFEGDPRPFDGTSAPRGDGSDYDIGADEYFIVARTYDFASSEESWTQGTAIVFSAPQFVVEAGRIKMVSQTNTNTFGYWSSTSEAVWTNPDFLYRVRYVVGTDITEQAVVPQVRLRANSSNLQQSDYLTIESSGDGGASPTAGGTTYDLYFVPPSNGTYCMLAFDLLNFNPDDAAVAELALDTVEVERFALNELTTPTLVRAYDFTTSEEGWSSGGAPIVFSNPEFLHEDGALILRSTTNTNTFGYWSSNPSDVTTSGGLLYRGTFVVRTDVLSLTAVPQMRLRFNAANLQASRTMGIESIGNGGSSPGTVNTTYDRLYFLPPASCVGAGLMVSMDELNFAPDDAANGSLILDRVVIESLAPPGAP